jgi:tRNA threonylcarbamoyladenosine biosynthesis protein TsaE
MTFTTKNFEETIELGEKLGKMLSGGEFLVLVGDLGGGKTQFTKGLAKGLGITETVVSPTFTIERIYESPKRLYLHHFDFYRLQKMEMEIESEVADLEKDDQNVIVVEWGKNIPGALPEEHLEVSFEYEDDLTRKISMKPRGHRYEKIIKELS